MDVSLSPDTPAGAVVWGVVAALLIWFTRLAGGPSIRFIRGLVQSTPRLRRALRIAGDRIYPTWRARVGETRVKYPLAWRVSELQGMKRPPLVIVGGLYLDLYLTPVDVSNLLTGVEFGNLDSIQVRCGGSAYFVGKCTFDRYGKRSHVFSRLGAGDPLSETLRSLLRKERWIEEIELTRIPNSQCGVSTHLVQRENGLHVTLTHRGALATLQWKPIQRKLRRKTKRGGILYISGYFRTGLHTDLCSTLERLPAKVLVCVDHGRFRKEEHPVEAAALLDAFSAGLVDIYICTFPEVCELMASAGCVIGDDLNTVDALKLFFASGKLPPVTVVRGDTEQSYKEAYVLFEGGVTRVAGGRQPRWDAPPGRKNEFNAVFVHALSVPGDDPSLPAAVHAAVRSAVT